MNHKDGKIAPKIIKLQNHDPIIYSIAETAKANDLKPYNYFELLLSEIPKHMGDTDLILVRMDYRLPSI